MIDATSIKEMEDQLRSIDFFACWCIVHCPSGKHYLWIGDDADTRKYMAEISHRGDKVTLYDVDVDAWLGKARKDDRISPGFAKEVKEVLDDAKDAADALEELWGTVCPDCGPCQWKFIVDDTIKLIHELKAKAK